MHLKSNLRLAMLGLNQWQGSAMIPLFEAARVEEADDIRKLPISVRNEMEVFQGC